MKRSLPPRDQGAYGIEAQFWEHEECRYSRRFDTRALAVQWAEEEQKAIEADTSTPWAGSSTA